MPLSQDPAARARQIANLHPGAALKHGGRSEAVVQELSSAYLAELQREYPGEPEHWQRLQSRRMAKIEARARYLEGRPSEVLNLRTGKTNPAADQEESLTKALLADLDRAEQRKRGAGTNGGGALEQLRQRGAQIISDQGGEHVGS